MNPGKVYTATYRLRHKDGSWRWVEVKVTNLISNPAVEGIVGNYRDATTVGVYPPKASRSWTGAAAQAWASGSPACGSE